MRPPYHRRMKWLVRIASAVLIAVLLLTLFREGVYARANIVAIAVVLTFAYWFEGFDVSKFWGDDDDDSQGPLKPT